MHAHIQKQFSGSTNKAAHTKEIPYPIRTNKYSARKTHPTPYPITPLQRPPLITRNVSVHSAHHPKALSPVKSTIPSIYQNRTHLNIQTSKRIRHLVYRPQIPPLPLPTSFHTSTPNFHLTVYEVGSNTSLFSKKENPILLQFHHFHHLGPSGRQIGALTSWVLMTAPNPIGLWSAPHPDGLYPEKVERHSVSWIR